MSRPDGGDRQTMKILSFSCQDVEETGWRFVNVNFGKTNLFVGGTSSGKSRMLNTMFNLGRFAVSKEFKRGHWNITFEHKDKTYNWIVETSKKNDDDAIVTETLKDITGKSEIVIVDRDANRFIFEGKELPKLTKNETSISLLKDEETIKPINDGFSLVLKRNFDKDALSNAAGIQSLPTKLIMDIEKENIKDIKKIFHADLSLSADLFILSKYFEEKYTSICDTYKSIFPFIREITIKDLGDINKNIAITGRTPRFCIKEEGVKDWISIENFSSGMLKVLLILTDIQTIPDNGVYLIDEYENSLGLNAIEFLPTYLLDLEKDIQFFITSHHPYIINRFPMKDWYVFHRKGYDVKIKFGEELVSRLGVSKHQAFTKLINDPFYTEGKE